MSTSIAATSAMSPSVWVQYWWAAASFHSQTGWYCSHPSLAISRRDSVALEVKRKSSVALLHISSSFERCKHKVWVPFAVLDLWGFSCFHCNFMVYYFMNSGTYHRIRRVELVRFPTLARLRCSSTRCLECKFWDRVGEFNMVFYLV